MKHESAVNGFTLKEVIFGNAYVRTTTESAVPADLWRRTRTWWARMLRLRLRAPRHLRLCESLPLGERRFVAVVEFESARFLVGGTSSSLVLLATLEKAQGEGDPGPSHPATGISPESQN